MDKEQFIKLIKQHQKQNELLDELERCGFDIYETQVIEFGFIMFDNVIKSNFNDEGIDWINWWLYEKNGIFGDLSAFDENDNETPFDTIEDLWNYVEKYRINNENFNN